MMRIALIESNIKWENKKANLDALVDAITFVSDMELDLVLLPEMSFTGFSMNVRRTKESDYCTVNKIKEISKKYDIAIGFGWVKDNGDKCENHYSIVKDSDILIDYVKIHPFSYSGENIVFNGGEKLYLCKFKDFSVGIQICYDLRFPETFQILSKEASLIVVPANWPQKRREHWNTLLKARAIENQVYMAGINCVGNIGEQVYSGDSVILSPNGEIVDPLKVIHSNDDNIYIYDIKNDVEKYRSEFPVKKDRREKLYAQLKNKTREVF